MLKEGSDSVTLKNMETYQQQIGAKFDANIEDVGGNHINKGRMLEINQAE
jgi:hypothetical protein